MSKTFTFINNGPYTNRGCEAIIRGTLELLNNSNNNYNNIAYFNSKSEMILHNKIDQAKIHHYQANRLDTTFSRKILRKFGYKNDNILDKKELQPIVDLSDVFLSIGGDNYSLDYGYPNKLLLLDNFILKQKKPLIIWGASIGPFTRDILFEREIINHFAKVTYIFVREEESLNYIDSLGLGQKTFLMADPAFNMTTKKPTGKKYINIENNSIGINLSPIVENFIETSNNNSWLYLATTFLSLLKKTTDRKIYLVPHVTKKNNSDYAFMSKIYSALDNKNNIVLIKDIYNAEETKWIISQFDVFCGARTHSTIAALSSCVPTLSLSYSIKSVGINNMIYNSLDYCYPVTKFKPEPIVQLIIDMLENNANISLNIKSNLFKIHSLLKCAKKRVESIIN